ncbi:hypothetical protein I79_024660 [Cricetulus griseus]|uniref:Uncharacterized protein n=1 Tax=Cricetulus griseus TaxID=10029 RepID=G3IL98_CRIGR|nr:hypothetical protein I79_024660 [Cricetulus griseus]
MIPEEAETRTTEGRSGEGKIHGRRQPRNGCRESPVALLELLDPAVPEDNMDHYPEALSSMSHITTSGSELEPCALYTSILPISFQWLTSSPKTAEPPSKSKTYHRADFTV